MRRLGLGLRMMIRDMKWLCRLQLLRHQMSRQRLRMSMMIRDMKWWGRLRVLRHQGMMWKRKHCRISEWVHRIWGVIVSWRVRWYITSISRMIWRRGLHIVGRMR